MAGSADFCINAIKRTPRQSTTAARPSSPSVLLLPTRRRVPAPVSMAYSSGCASGPQRVALVTGANKGIGKEIARKLSSAEQGTTVILGCRNEDLGVSCAGELRAAGCDAIFQRLDLNDSKSIVNTFEFIQEVYGGLDILVNNAAVCFNDPTLYGKVPFTPFEQQASVTVNTNFFGTLELTEAMLPLLRASSSPRIVNVASAAGRLSILKSQKLVDAFTAPDLELPELESLIRRFVEAAEAGDHASEGWPNTCYGVSKLGLIALTRVLARDEKGVMVNSVDPGYCATDQNRNQGTIGAEEGARTAAMLAMLPEEEFVTGEHFFQGEPISWWYRR